MAHNPSPRPPWTQQPSPRRAAWYPYPDNTRAPLGSLLARRSLNDVILIPQGGMANARPVITVPCEIILSIARGSNGKVLNVRCRCMAGTASEPSPRFYAYDMLGRAGSLDEALQMWRDHRDGKHGR